MELIEAVEEFLRNEFPTKPYAYKTRVNLVGNELVEFMVNSNGAVRFFLAPHPEHDEKVIEEFIKNMRKELR